MKVIVFEHNPKSLVKQHKNTCLLVWLEKNQIKLQIFQGISQNFCPHINPDKMRIEYAKYKD